MTLDQGHDTSLGYGRQLCEILLKSNVTVQSYGLDEDFSYVRIVTLIFEIYIIGSRS